jgi:beta-lactamase regulating signal transducer with metallopeptidase domain
MWLLDAAYLAAAVATIALTAFLINRIVTAGVWGRAIWRAALLTSFGLILVQISGAGPELAERTRHAMQKRHRASTAGSPISNPTPPQLTTTPRLVPEQLVIPEAPGPPPLVEPRETAPSGHGNLWLLCFWMAGTAILLARVLTRRLIFLWVRSHGTKIVSRELLDHVSSLTQRMRIRRQVRVVEFRRIQAPIAFGVFRPTVGLPTDFLAEFSVSQRDVMLAHELAHLSVHDNLWYLLADTTVALLWWHPAVWWLRRALHHASEVAADEASLLVENGPSILAECLIHIGDRMRPSRTIASMSVSGFRSGLGRRVASLLDLKDQPWSGQRRLFLPAFLVAALLLPVFVFCSPFTTTNRSNKGDTMNVWKRSLPGFALLALLNTGGPAVAEEPTKPASVPKTENRTAEVKRWSNAARIRVKLNQIVLDQVRYDGLPLGEVIRQLMEESRRRDPERQGINFLVVNNVVPNNQTIDPATGLPIASSEPVDVNSTTVRIDPGLNNVRLSDVLEAIVTVADRPLRYSIYDYGVVFSLDPMQGTKEEMITETFQVQPDIFFKGIESAFGIEVPRDAVGPSATPRSTMLQLWTTKMKQAEDDLRVLKSKYTDEHPQVREAQKAVETARREVATREEETQSTSTVLPGRETQQQIFRELFSRLGIRLDPPRTAFFNELTGILMVRVSPFGEMEAVRAAIETLGGTPTSKLASTAKATN